MSPVFALRNRLLDHPMVHHVLEGSGIHVRQYRLLLDLFDTLAERYEMLGTVNTLAMTMLASSSLFMGILPSLYALARPPLSNYLLVSIGITMLQLFLIYSLALTSLYLAAELFLLEGLPFANPVRLATQAIIVPVMLLGGMGGAVLAFLQWLIFRSYTAAVIATATVALLAVVIVRFSLSHLVSEFQTNLLTLAQGPARLFKTLDYD